MTLIESIILGLVQGITEFLPVSSSGHLAILSVVFGIEEGNLFYSVMLHFATLLSVLIYFYKDIFHLVKGFFTLIIKRFRKSNEKMTTHERMVILIIIGTIPTGLIGILFKDFFEGMYTNLTAVGVALLITGTILLLSEKLANTKHDLNSVPMYKAGLIGLFQGLAIAPGVSRSGSTIVGALFVGLNREEAARFSFLLSIPAILGAILLEALSLQSNLVLIDANLLIGMVISFVSGLFAIGLLMQLIKKQKLYFFSIYVYIVAIIVILMF